MTDLDKEKLAASAMMRLSAFNTAIAENRRKYPMHEFGQFTAAARTYIEAVHADSLIDRNFASAINGLSDLLKYERKAVPGEVLYEVDRLGCLLFCGYDPYFEGDEPPSL